MLNVNDISIKLEEKKEIILSNSTGYTGGKKHSLLPKSRKYLPNRKGYNHRDKPIIKKIIFLIF